MTSLFSLKNLSLSFPNKLIFKNINLTVNQGERIGVLGLNGHGKSSLFKIITSDIAPDTTTPAFIFDKSSHFSFFYIPQELPELQHWDIENYFYYFYPHLWQIKLRLQIVSDKIENGDYSDSVLAEQSALFEKLDKLKDEELHNRYLNYLRSFHIDINQKLSMLSGGEQRKIALSLGLSSPYELILWDEPTNHLDLETIEYFEEELMNCQKTVMIISHDRTLLNNVVDKIIHIQKGTLQSFKGTYEQYLGYLREQDAKRAKELDRLNNYERREKSWIQRGVKARRTKSKKRIEDYASLNSQIAELKSKAHKSVDLNLKFSNRKSKQLITGEDIELKYDNKVLINKLKFSIAKGDKIALLGRNGSGKTSFLRMLQGELTPSKGQLKIVDQLQIGYFSQKRESLDENISAFDLLGEGIDFIISNTGEKKHVTSYLENFLFSPDEIKRPIHTFSGGEKNRLQLAQFMKHAKDLWVFDEPTNDLDLETIGILEDELRRYEGALIIVGHDRSFIDNTTDKCWLIHDQDLHQFDGGLAQAEYYLEATALEEKLRLQSTDKKNNIVEQKNKPSQKDLELLESATQEISLLEKNIEVIKDQMAKFDYQSSDPLLVQKIKKSQQELHKLESRLDSQMSIWEKLIHKTQL